MRRAGPQYAAEGLKYKIPQQKNVSKKYKEQIDSNYAWIIKNASGTLIKLVTEEEENTDEE